MNIDKLQEKLDKQHKTLKAIAVKLNEIDDIFAEQNDRIGVLFEECSELRDKIKKINPKNKIYNQLKDFKGKE